MKPEEIKPDTELCTILGYNAQTGNCRRYFNRCMKTNEINATAIALNIKEDHFEYIMKNLAESKVKKMIIEHEFCQNIVHFCDDFNDCAKEKKFVDFVEVIEGKIVGYCLDDDIDEYIGNPNFVDERIRLAMKMMLLSKRWYNAKIDMDLIPTMI